MGASGAAAMLAVLAVLAGSPAAAFYLPGVAPTSYRRGDAVPLYVNSVKPVEAARDHRIHSLTPYDYYHDPFHFCPPSGGPEYVAESLGSILFGDRIMTSPFELRMATDTECRALCESHYSGQDAAWTSDRIEEGYILNWLIDGLPAGQEFEDPRTNSTFYTPGFLMGSADGDESILFNHYQIIVDYHLVGGSEDELRVVGAQVVPLSRDYKGDACGDSSGPVRLDADDGDDDGDDDDDDDDDTNNDTNGSGGSEDGHKNKRKVHDKDGPSSSKTVKFTYEVKWRPNKTAWATRWDKYLHVFDPNIQWFFLITTAVVDVFLVATVSSILLRALRKDIARYNRLDQISLEDLSGTSMLDEGVQEDSGWKLVHGDAFRMPPYLLLLSVLLGSGAQLFVMFGFTIALALLGFLSPSNRGSLGTVTILLYTVLSLLGGYVSARVYKAQGGERWKTNMTLTPLLVPGLTFAVFFLLNLFLWGQGSSGAVPLTTMLVIIGIWFLISVPLSVAGSWLGFRAPSVRPPVRTNQIPRQIPPAPSYLRLLPSMLEVGALPFLAILVELYFILTSFWFNKIYYMFGFLFLCYSLMVISSCAVTVLMIYNLLCSENYNWQWRAFLSSGMTGGYVFTTMLVYWIYNMKLGGIAGSVLYLGYCALVSFFIFILTGTIGYFASWCFVTKIYSSIKID